MSPSTLEQALHVHALARRDPDRVHPDDIAAVLAPDLPSSAHDRILETVRIVRDEKPDLTALAEELLTALERSSTPDALVLQCLREVASEEPGLVLPSVDAVIARFAAESVEVRGAAVACASELAADDPTAFVDAVPTLAILVEEEEKPVHQGSVYVLAKVAHEYPEEVMPVVPQLLSDLENRDVGFQTCALSALGAVVSSYPTVGRDATDTFGTLASTSGSAMVRTNAMGLLADVAQEHPATVEPHVDRLVEALESDETLLVRNAATAIANVGEAGVGAIPGLLEALDHPDPIARRNAARALGELGATVAVEQLKRAAEADPDEEVRTVATWAIEQIRTGGS